MKIRGRQLMQIMAFEDMKGVPEEFQRLDATLFSESLRGAVLG